MFLLKAKFVARQRIAARVRDGNRFKRSVPHVPAHAVPQFDDDVSYQPLRYVRGLKRA